ncbi:hypothetical protein M406DRAFT_71038 [Cryphonectria parasitica EP155]|uniref:Small secreted protein n=1 Tax=Cryphonectria parasitica (strain ATCC 38755 / EP155) TaxID=660469 RepID=A0A9P5CMI3_CRYP1|nr:uncharacterized protein M406DRAFT_71038 [Cryphonectria parasitica EP155]KAF3764419.1 hypothetical protein M406DRAFT_71038 [Cryphonectria parasitica EP155]
MFSQLSLALLFVAGAAQACDSTQPAIKDANTVTVKLYSDDTCCNVLQTTSLGVLDECHTANGAFYSHKMAVGANMFGRDIHWAAYETTDCSGAFEYGSLTNNDTCWLDGLGSTAALHSFKITVLD